MIELERLRSAKTGRELARVARDEIAALADEVKQLEQERAAAERDVRDLLRAHPTVV